MIIKIHVDILHTHTYIFKHVSLNNKDNFCLYNLFKILSIFQISVLVSGRNCFERVLLWYKLSKLSKLF